MSVEILFLGTGDAFGSGGRLQSAALIRSAGANILVDCGATVLPALRRHGVDPGEVDTILLTHLHGDHFGGLPFVLMDAAYASRRERPLTVIGPPGTEPRAAGAHRALFGGSGTLPIRFPLTWTPWLDGEPVAGPGFTAVARRVAHAPDLDCYGLRVSCGDRVVAFSGDTAWTDALLALAADADLFVCECYGFDGAPPHHLDYATLARERSRLTCRRLLLTHMGDDMLRRIEGLEIDAAADGLRLVL